MKQNTNNKRSESQEVHTSEKNLSKTDFSGSQKKRGPYIRKFHTLLRLYSVLHDIASENEDHEPVPFSYILEKMRSAPMIFSSDDSVPKKKNIASLLSDPDVLAYSQYAFPASLELISEQQPKVKVNDKQIPRGVLELESGNRYHTFDIELSVKNEDTPTDKSSTNLVRLTSPIRSSTWRLLFDFLAVCPGIPKGQAEDQMRFLFRYVLGKLKFPAFYPKYSGNDNFLEILFILSGIINSNEKNKTNRQVELTLGSYVFPEHHREPVLNQDTNTICNAQPVDFRFIHGRYYVIFLIDNKVQPIPADRILAVKEIRQVKKLTFNTPSFSPICSYTPSKNPIQDLYPNSNTDDILMRCSPEMLEQAIISFPGVRLYKTKICEDGLIEFSAVQLPHPAALSFALQHLPNVEIIEPASLREELKTILSQAQKKYHFI